ncbi:MAG: Fic family protein [Patescibacteria group bacterium]
MAKKFSRPKTKRELDDKEVAGLWRAIGLVKSIADSRQKITLNTIRSIHAEILKDSEPQIAGKFRVTGQGVRKLRCVQPPEGSKVNEEIYNFWRDFDYRSSLIQLRPRFSSFKSTKYKKWWSDVIELAVWAQHKFVSIHPFSQGNGRTARLLTNLVLQRYGIKPSQVKYEGDMKEKYLEALCRADKYRDYEPLKQIVIKGVIEVYKKEKKLRQRLKAEKSKS